MVYGSSDLSMYIHQFGSLMLKFSESNRLAFTLSPKNENSRIVLIVQQDYEREFEARAQKINLAKVN